MSALAGIIHFDGAPLLPGHIERMTAALAQHGPDARMHWVADSVAFGHCMLRTTPQSLEETQPLANEAGTVVLVMDGRVDNWELLRKELVANQVMPRTHADAELVLLAYEVWGDKFLQHIEGDFALVIWDRLQQTAVCARDRVGNKQLHYYWDGNTLLFASRPLGILALPSVPRRCNEGLLAEFLAGQHYSNSETFWQGILRLPPAQLMRVDAKGPRLHTYWQPDVWASISYRTADDYAGHYLELFTDTVRRMSRSLAPVAYEVSGGLDSSSLFCMATHLYRQGSLPAPAIEAYGLAFPHDPAADESRYRQAVGSHCGRSIQEITPSCPPLQWYRQRAQQWGEFPGIPSGIMSTALYEKARADGSRVVLSGWAGDEWLGGSRSYYADTLAARQWRQLYTCLRTDWQQCGGLTSLWWLLGYGVLPLLPFALRTRLRALVTPVRKFGVDRDAWLSEPLKTRIAERRRLHQQSARPQVTARVGQRSQLNFLRDHEWLQHAEFMEKLAADCGLEVRRPFTDARIIQFAFSTAEHVRQSGKIDRVIHRNAMTGFLPDLVRTRPDKADFMGTFHRYLPELNQDLTFHIPARRQHWVNAAGAEQLCRMAANDQHQGWPEALLWHLFGCDAIFPGSQP